MAHDHKIHDSDHHYSISPITRAITNSSPSAKTILMQHDHNSERFSFDIQRTIEGHDISNCNKIEVHYTNTDANNRNVNVGVYEVEDLAISEDFPSMLTFSWLVSENATMYAGKLSFLITFACIENGVCTYRWNTGINNSITIAKGMNNGESIAESYPDILSQWKAEAFAAVYGFKAINYGPTEPEVYPYIWFNTADENEAGIGRITIKDANGNVYVAYPKTKLGSIEGFAEDLDKRMKPYTDKLDKLKTDFEEHDHTVKDISDFPKPKKLAISLDGVEKAVYDTSEEKSIDITPENIGASRSDHEHSLIRTKANKMVTIDPIDWVENVLMSGRMEFVIESEDIKSDNLILMTISDSQKSAHAWGMNDPVDGSVLVYVAELPAEPLVFKMKILEQTEV